ncbi:MAG TPA: hypothetical protein VFY40_02565 [Blastocatellia bacterium]|nr:hypothetical protein [Blastocatellia bacterium]
MKMIATIISFIVIVATVFAKPCAKATELLSNVMIDKQDDKKYGLPSGAVIIEEQSLKSGGHPDRMLILWMINPERKASGAQRDPKYDYTCQDETRGSYYIGPTRVSLLNSQTQTVINTIEITYFKDDANFHIPYAIRNGYYYKVEGSAPERVEAKPHITWLKDYNGDGKALEFALFYKEECDGPSTTLIGYSERQDKIIQYPITLELAEVTDHTIGSHVFWFHSLFSQQPISPGEWKYEIDKRDKGGWLSKCQISYDAQNERFVGRIEITKGKHEKR